MEDEVSKRLRHLRDDIDGLSGRGAFGFGLLRTLPAFVPPCETWEYLETVLAPRFAPTRRHGRITKCDGWLDRSPTWRYCIWWWGDKKCVEEYKGWGDKMYGLMSDYPDLVPIPSWLIPEEPKTNYETGSFIIPSGYSSDYRLGYHSSLVALLSFAAQDPALARIEERVVIDGQVIGPGADVMEVASGIPHDLQFYPWLKYVFTEMDADAVTFSRRVLDRLLGAPSEPSVVVDLTTDVIYVDGIPCVRDKTKALIVNSIVSANGNWRSSSEIREECHLPEKVRIDRIVNRLPGAIRQWIESQQGKGYRKRLP